MASVSWIKLRTDIMTDEKIRLLRSLPNGDTFFCIWIEILTLVGRNNSNGMLVTTSGIPYNATMLSVVLYGDEHMYQSALDAMVSFGLLKLEDGIYTISAWERNQSTEKLQKIRNQQNERQSRCRSKKNFQTVKPITIESDDEWLSSQ